MISTQHLEHIRNQGKLVTLKKSKSSLIAVNNEEIDVVGRFETTLTSPSTTIRDIVYVVKDLAEPILSESSLLRLGLMTYCPKGTLNRVHNTKELEKSILDELKEIHPEVFDIDKLGRVKNFQATLRLKKDAQGCIARPRRIPLHFEKETREKIQKFVKLGILTKCRPDERLKFCSPIVVTKKRDGSARLCCDYRLLNQYLNRTRITSKMSIENLLQELRGGKVFFTLDVKEAFHQIPLTESCQHLTAISTPLGNFKFRRLPMGLVNASDIFDSVMSTILAGLKNVTFYRDDIYGCGVDKQDHDRTLRKVIARLADNGIRVNPKKSSIHQERLEFLGYILTAEGLRPDPKKVKAIREAPRPESKEALISFLCSLAYNERFIMRFSEKAASLHDLARAQGPLLWSDENAKKFEELKSALVEEALNATFVPGKETAIFVDAGKKNHQPGRRGGFSAILCQRDTESEPWSAIHFASKRMTEVQTRYSQTELEAKAIEYACQKYKYYVDGIDKLTIISDCKPLVSLFNQADKPSIPPRIEKVVLNLQHLPITVVHLPGKSQPADFFSRNPVDPENSTKVDNEEALLVKRVQLEKKGSITWKEIQRKTAECPVLSKVIQCIKANEWDTNMAKTHLYRYLGVRDLLSVIDGVVFKNDQVVVPEALTTKLIKQLVVPPLAMRDDIAVKHHRTGHQGITKTMALLKERYWWPGFREEVEEAVKTCPVCLFTTSEHRKEPMRHTRMPPHAFHTISADFKGPTKDGRYVLVIFDLYSRWPEAYLCSSTSFRTVKKFFLRYFADHGHPRKVKTDGGPPFNSQEWKEFHTEFGIKPKKTTPLHPQANGEVEGFMKVIQKTIDLCSLTGSKLDEEIHNQLMAFRATPNMATGMSPAELVGKQRYYLNQLGDTEKMDHTYKREINVDALRQEVDMKKESNDRYHSRRNRKPHNLEVGQKVLLNLDKKDQEFAYDTNIYTITEILGSSIKAEDEQGRSFMRDSSKVKRYREPKKKDKPSKQRDTEPSESKEAGRERRHTRSRGPVPEQPWIRTSRK